MQTSIDLQHQKETPDKHARENVRTMFNRVFDVQLATSQAAIDEVFAVRYQVYCIDRAFEDPKCFDDNREHDAYDPRSAHALIRHRATQDSVAAVRLVMAGDDPEQSEFPMEGPCVTQMNQSAQKAIRSAQRKNIAEISRMAVSREFRRRLNEHKSASGVADGTCYYDPESGKRAMPYISLGLFAAILRMSVRHGITHWMAVMEPAQLRLLKRFGVEFDHVGPVLEYHGVRRPAFTEAASLIDRIKIRRPDVWSLITDAGRHLPAKPRNSDSENVREVA